MTPKQKSLNWQGVIKTPIGNIGISTTSDDNHLAQLCFVAATLPTKAPSTNLAKRVAIELQSYFHDAAYKFSVPLKLAGTPLQQKIWGELKKIKPGKTVTYGQLAERLQTSPRVIGNACRANPVLIFIPCHRVVGVNGLGGYGGACAKNAVERDERSPTNNQLLQHKRWLLEHESEK